MNRNLIGHTLSTPNYFEHSAYVIFLNISIFTALSHELVGKIFNGTLLLFV